MAFKSSSFTLIMLSFMVVTFLADVSTARGDIAEPPTSSFQPLDPKDPEAIKVAEFAIKQQNTQAKSDLVFDSVIEGAYEDVTVRIIYGLVIAAKDGNVLNRYDAVVFEKGNNGFELVAFKKV